MNADLRHTFRRFAEWSASCVRCAFHATTRRNVLSTGPFSAVSDSKVDMCEQPVVSIGSSKRPSGVAGELVRDLVAELGEAMFMRNRGPVIPERGALTLPNSINPTLAPSPLSCHARESRYHRRNKIRRDLVYESHTAHEANESRQVTTGTNSTKRVSSN